jgi:hypothetical protein
MEAAYAISVRMRRYTSNLVRYFNVLNENFQSVIMKSRILLLTVLILSACSRIEAQGFHLGIKGGTNLSEITSQSFQNSLKGNLMGGAFAEINFTSKWGIQPEVLYSQVTSETTDNPSQNVKLQYLYIPILLSYKLPIPILSLQLGPQFASLLNKNDNLVVDGKNAFKSGDFSMVLGAQVNLLMFKGGIRYVYGLTNINNITNQQTWETRTVQIYVGLRIF